MKILLQEGKRKLEMEISGSTTIFQLKKFVASNSGAGPGPAPGDQKLICKGKDLSAVAGGDDATTIEKLATLKIAIADGTKILVMRKAGSAARPTPYAGGGSEDNAAQQQTSAAEGEEVQAAVQTDTVLLLRDDQQLVQGATPAHQNQFALKIKQGPNSHTVRIPSAAAGADVATWADVAAHLATYCVPDVPSPDHYRFIVKGKEQFPLRREVQTALLRMGIRVPTKIQLACIPKLMATVSSSPGDENGPGGATSPEDEQSSNAQHSNSLRVSKKSDFQSVLDIQRRYSFSGTYRRASLLLVAGTGTGKTVAYLAPLLHNLLESKNPHLHPMVTKPRCLVIVPTRELAVQILKVVRAFPNVTSAAAAPGQSWVQEARTLQNIGVDFLVGTPHRLLIHIEKKNLNLRSLESVVLDEADTLCDTFYEADICKLLTRMNKSDAPQVVLCSALKLRKMHSFDSHKVAANVDQCFVPTRGRLRRNVLTEVLSEAPLHFAKEKTLVFTNTVKSCKSLQKHLKMQGIDCDALHGELGPRKRSRVIRAFSGEGGAVDGGGGGSFSLTRGGGIAAADHDTEDPEEYLRNLPSASTPHHGDGQKSKGKTSPFRTGTVETLRASITSPRYEKLNDPSKPRSPNLLIATNLASRGLDISDINHVVMYDLPQTLADYIHRIGRTGRAGASGRVTTIMRRGDLPLVKQIQDLTQDPSKLDMKYTSNSIRKILNLEKWKFMLQNMKKKTCRGDNLKKLLGLPPNKNIGSPENKKIRAELERRIKLKKHAWWLGKMGRLPKGHGIPRMPDARVEGSESQTISVLTKEEETGTMQVQVKRRMQEARMEEQRELSGGTKWGGKTDVIGEVTTDGGGSKLIREKALSDLSRLRRRKAIKLLGGQKFHKHSVAQVDMKQLPDLMMKEGSGGKIEVAKGESGAAGGEDLLKKSSGGSSYKNKRRRPQYMAGG
eukprot:g8995.t1